MNPSKPCHAACTPPEWDGWGRLGRCVPVCQNFDPTERPDEFEAAMGTPPRSFNEDGEDSSVYR